MVAKQATARARGFAIAEGRTPPRRVQRAGFDVIEGIFQFETEVGRGFGVVRLLAAEPSQGLSAHDRPARAQRLRGKDRQAPADRRSLLAQFRRDQLEGAAHRRPGIYRPRAHGADRRRRPGRTVARGDARADRRGHAGRGQVRARRRLLAPALPLARAAQRHPLQPPALHAVPGRRGRPTCPRTWWPTGSRPTRGRWRSISGPARSS